jgi:hypothetical protein
MRLLSVCGFTRKVPLGAEARGQWTSSPWLQEGPRAPKWLDGPGRDLYLQSGLALLHIGLWSEATSALVSSYGPCCLNRSES